MPKTARLHVQDVLVDDDVLILVTPFTIGRRESNMLRLGAAEVSREHAEIVREGDQFVLRDKQSRYGTYVNGVQVAEHLLVSGDRIRMGRGGGAELRFSLEDTNWSLSSGPLATRTGGIREVAEMLEGLRALGHSRVLPEVLALVLDSAIAASGAERGFIMLATPEGRLEFTLARGRGGEPLETSSFQTSRKIPEAAFVTGEIQIVRDIFQPEFASDHPDTFELGIRYVLCLPLHVLRFVDRGDSGGDDRRLGVLYLDSRKEGALQSTAVRSALETLADEAAVAIENARLYREAAEKSRMEQEMRLASSIQRTLLPQAAINRPCMQAAAASVPCRSIGGDFFDYADLPDRRLAFTLGDVAGKGPSAALLAALLQGMFSLAAQDDDDPASLMARVNAALCRRALESRFATLFHGILDPAGRLIYCNGGHNAPFVVGPSGVRRLETGGPVVGILDGAPYADGVEQLAPGDVVLVFSDGVSEAPNPCNEEYGDDRILCRLRALVAASPPLDATRIVESVTADVAAFTAGAPQRDDITVMAVRYRGVVAD